MGACGPIPWDAIHAFAQVHEFDSTQVEYDAFMLIIQNLDNAFLEVQRKDVDRQKASREAQGARRRPMRRHRR